MFHGYLRELHRSGKVGRDVAASISNAITEAQLDGKITRVERTKHGESRLPNAEKYDLGNGYRLVVQLLDGNEKTRVFLFAGKHDDAERWLDEHRNFRWIMNAKSGALSFAPVTEETPPTVPAFRTDLEATDDYLDLVMLRDFSEQQLTDGGLSGELLRMAVSITGRHYEEDADSILLKVIESGQDRAGNLLLDLLVAAASKDWRAVQRRLDLATGGAIVADGTTASAAMAQVVNGDEFITFDDEINAAEIMARGSLADWMLFLHPEQRKIAQRDFLGAARLRGVSGSGKTSVLVHRARYLAKKYDQPVLLVTLTESMRKLLDHLCSDLCGIERDKIQTMTIGRLVTATIRELHPRGRLYANSPRDDELRTLIERACGAVRAAPEYAGSQISGLNQEQLFSFVTAELAYVRGRLTQEQLDDYVDTAAFRRRGRQLALNEAGRRAVLAGLRVYESELQRLQLRDHEGFVADALKLVQADAPPTFRCILADEVQDFSQLEIQLIARLPTPAGRAAEVADGLFLTGDGAQTIYRKGFVLKRAGVDISGRSFVLKKSYRNTFEILRAAFSLVERYEFADEDDASIAAPSAPEFAKRRGERPQIVRCASEEEEAAFVARSVHSLLAMGHNAGQICFIAASKSLRAKVADELKRLGIGRIPLRDDVNYESNNVKISTIESAKGHEFGAVFVGGLVDGVLPISADPEEQGREAARFYVAMTRAREKLTISFSPSGRAASPFLAPVAPYCDQKILRGHELRSIPP